jgi:rhodanese-related sulfurtransferase
MAVPRITKEELKARLEDAAPDAAPVLIDVRLKYPFEHSTLKLPKAVRVLPERPDFTTLPKTRDIVAYDSDPEEIVSAEVTALLIRQGYRAAALKGGIAEWITAKYPTESKPAPQSAPPTPGSLKG